MTHPEPQPEVDLAHLGEYLKGLRRKRKLSQEDAGNKAGITAGFLSQVERGTKRPSFENIVRLAFAYDTSPNPVIAIAYPDLPVWVEKKEEMDASPDPFRPRGWSYRNAIYDPSFRYLRFLESPEANVQPENKTFIGEVYEAIWDLHLDLPQVKRLYEEAIHDPKFLTSQRLREAPEPSVDVMRATAEIYLKYKQERDRVESSLDAGRSGGERDVLD